MYTIAAGLDCHVLVEEPWVKLNHSFDPNCSITMNALRLPGTDASLSAGYLEISTCREVEEGAALEFDYCTTEYEMSDPFVDMKTGK